MTITLDISPQAETELSREASLQGVDFTAHLREILERHARDIAASKKVVRLPLPSSPQMEMSPDEWIARFEAATFPPAPVLSPEATNRESIYDEATGLI